MDQDVHLAPISTDDREAIVVLFNYYVEHDFSAFPEQPVPAAVFGKFLDAAAGYPTVTAKDDGRLLGFGLLRSHAPFPTLARTAEITYFVAPDQTRRGIGSQMLAELESGGRRQGIATILAAISSLNDKSLAFHRQHGFTEVGRFREVGQKMNRLFDVVWMQKML